MKNYNTCLFYFSYTYVYREGNGKPVGKVNDSALRRVKKEDPVSMVEVFYSIRISI